MNEGNWVPIDKRLKYFLPLKRKYSKVEAAFSLQLDYDSGNNVSAAGYSKLWGWSRNKVSKFLTDMDVAIESGKQGKNAGVITQKQKGHQKDIKRTSKGHPKLKQINKLKGIEDIKRTSKGHQKDTTIDTNTKKDIKTPPVNVFDCESYFNTAWKSYPKKDGRKKAFEHYQAQIKDEATATRFASALDNYRTYISREQITIQFVKNGSTFFNNWEDWETMPQQTPSAIPNQSNIFLPDGEIRFVS